MKITIYKTHEINEDKWLEIVDGFNKCFNTNKTIHGLKTYYTSNCLGYSIHALAVDDISDRIIGHNSIVPQIYVFQNQKEVLIGLSGGTYVLKEFRKDIFIYFDMIKELRRFCVNEGFVMIFGVLNENSYKYALKFNEETLIGFLPYYVLPINPMQLANKARLNFLNIIFKPLLWLHLLVNLIITSFVNNKEVKTALELKIDDNFYMNRFNNERYFKHITFKYRSYYSIVNENGIRAAYLFDFRESDVRTTRSLTVSLVRILKHNPDIIIFIGKLNFCQLSMIRLPEKFEPQKLPLTYTMLIKNLKEFEKKNIELSDINFGLINFDVR
jgi:hypothetical protein